MVWQNYKTYSKWTYFKEDWEHSWMSKDLNGTEPGINIILQNLSGTTLEKGKSDTAFGTTLEIETSKFLCSCMWKETLPSNREYWKSALAMVFFELSEAIWPSENSKYFKLNFKKAVLNEWWNISQQNFLSSCFSYTSCYHPSSWCLPGTREFFKPDWSAELSPPQSWL